VMLRFGGPPERAVCSAARWPRRQLRNPTWSWRRIKRLKALERENATLKRLLADGDLERLHEKRRRMENQAATQRDEPVTIRMRRCRPRGATSARHITLAQKTRQSITRKCNAFGANKGFERHGAGRSGHHSERRTRNALVR